MWHAPLRSAALERKLVRFRTAIKNGSNFCRWLESDDVAQRLLELRALRVEGAAGHRDADRAEEVAFVVEHGRGQAAEVALELLALGGDAAQPHVPQLFLQRVGLGDGRSA